MPYKLVFKPSNHSYAVETIATGKTHGWTTKENAEAQLRVLNSLYQSGESQKIKAEIQKPKCMCVGKKSCPY
jgi:hypothetical protein